MARWIKKSTSVTIRLGPFLDRADGVTEKTALSLVYTDVQVSKDNGAFANKHDQTAPVHEANGWYRVVLDETDTDTYGSLVIKSDNAAVHLPVWQEFTVVSSPEALVSTPGNVTALCNDALGQIGQDFITAIDDGSKAANLCARFFPELRDAVLRDHTWNCAMKRAALAQSATAPLFEWAYSYPLPADCLRVLRLGTNDDVGWKIEGRNLVTDESSVKILYIARVSDPNQWDSMLYQALSAYLASKLASALPHDIKLAMQMYELYRAKVRDAKAVDGQEGIQE